MITGIEALRLVEAYLDRRSKYEDERWQAGDANLEEFDSGWCVYVYSIGPEGGEPPTTCAFVLLVGRDGKVYLPRLTSIERDMDRLARDPSSLNPVFEPEDLDDG